MSQQLFGRFKSPLKNRGSLQSTNGLQCHNWLVLSSVATASIHWDAPISNFHGTSYFSNPLEVPHQTARFNPKRKHNNWQIREEIEEIIIDFTFFRHRRWDHHTVVEQSTIPNRRHGAQGQLAAALAEVTRLKAEKVGPVMAMWQHQWRFEWRNPL